MPTQRRFEANSLAAVLAKVQKEVGPGAKISSAQRVRSGGVMGFFQREKFEVLVDVPAPGETPEPTPALQPAPATATSLLELAEQMNSEESRPDGPSTGAQTSSAQAAPATMRITPAPATASPEEPQISTESDTFAEVLSRIAFQSHMTSEASLTSNRGSDDIDDDADEEGHAATEVSQPTDDGEAAASPPVSSQPVAPQPALPAAASSPAASQPVIEDRPSFLDVPAKVETPTPEVPALRTRITDSPLYSLGLPVDYIPVDPNITRSTEQVRKALTETLAKLPEAPYIRPSRGAIIAVVGDRSEAVDLAEDLAQNWGRAPEEIVVASQSYRDKNRPVIRSVRTAEDSRRSWSRRERPTVVAIDARVGSRNTAWAEHLLTALEPIATYGVADATYKAEDIAAWADALGGVDCLALNHVDSTVSPASVLATGIPVERIDGRKASPAYWAMLLADRLTVA